MAPRRKINRPNFLNLNGVSYSFKMTDHLNKQLEDEDEILTKICKLISKGYEQEFPSWARLPADGCRIILITQRDELYQCLDADARSKVYNFLIFQKTGEKSIKITHFGPIGKKQDGTFQDKLNQTDKELMILKEMLNKLRSSDKTTDDKEKEEKEILAEVIADYWAPLHMIELQINASKEELLDLTNHVYGDSKNRETARELIGKINVSASTGKIVLKSITAILFAELAEEIAKKIAAKTAAKTATKVAAKTGTKGGGKMVAKAVPFLGLAVGTAFGAWRLWQGDLAGAGLEIASGAASCVPGGGTAASLAIDACILTKDIYQAKDASNQNLEMLNLQIEQIESCLNDLSEKYEESLTDYEFVKDVLEDPDFSAGKLEQEIQTLNSIADALRGPLITSPHNNQDPTSHHDGVKFDPSSDKLLPFVYCQSFEFDTITGKL